ncbi:Methionine adenosyltransferase 2 subunit beta, partial [Blyttiomyces sp. JEL0837]
MATSTKPKVLVTGASGLLGRAVFNAFDKDGKYDVIGLAFSRATDRLEKLDLTDFPAVETYLSTHLPTVIIHCAAERRPDKAESDKAGVLKLNVDTVRHLASISKKFNAWFLYISSDYVFDGRNPPYNVNDKPNPINFYGETKLAGEVGCLEGNQEAVVVRIPVLYGDAKTVDESA